MAPHQIVKPGELLLESLAIRRLPGKRSVLLTFEPLLSRRGGAKL